MLFSEELVEELNSRKIIQYENLAAFCYSRLKDILDAKKIREEQFLAQYIETREADPEYGQASDYQTNPNLMRMNRLVTEILRIIEYDQESLSILAFSVSADLPEDICRIINAVRKAEMELIPFGDEELNRASIIFFLLEAICAATEIGTIQLPDNWTGCPLNSHYRDKVWIFQKKADAFWKKNKGYFFERNRFIYGNTIANQIQGMTFVKPSNYADYQGVQSVCVTVKELRLPSVKTKECEEKEELRIALVPMKCTSRTKFEYVAGADFRVVYDPETEKAYIVEAISILEKCIQEGYQVVVFPEFICSPAVHDAIQKYLENYRRRSGKLLLVVAGTGWYKDKDGKGNNILKVYDYNGKLIGEQYKHAAFHKEGEIISSEQDTDGITTGIRSGSSEMLSEPGKKLLILDVQGIGRIAFAVCRDICDDAPENLTTRVLYDFDPDFVFVPAWSSSIQRGFESKFGVFADKGIISVLCNACEARRRIIEKGGAIGMVGVPSYSGSAEPKLPGTWQILSEPECAETCVNKLCFIGLTLALTKQNILNGKYFRHQICSF